MMIKKIKETPRHKKHEQKGKFTIIGLLPPKVIGNGFMWNGVEGVRDVHLKHYLVRMDIKNNLDTMNHNLTLTLNNHIELMWW